MHRRVEVKYPGRMVLTADSKAINMGWDADNPNSPNSCAYRHDGSINLLFLDGHTETSKHPIFPDQGNTKYNWVIGEEKY
jgi:prepilin-type processing-associated H-X9-DG protein